VSDLAARLAALTPAQKELLTLRLRKKNLPLPEPQSIPRRTGTGPWPLTHEQGRFWSVQQTFPWCNAYNIHNQSRFDGAMNVPALGCALGEMVRRHEILRTLFVTRDGVPFQAVQPAAAPALPLVDLSSLPADLRRREQRRTTLRQGQQPFALAVDLPLRLLLLRLAPGHHVLIITLHHIATDWWSSNLFQHELTALYGALAEGRPPALPSCRSSMRTSRSGNAPGCRARSPSGGCSLTG
jgi:hypothetical protein